MAEEQTLQEILDAAAADPKRVQVKDHSVENHSLSEIVAARQAAAAAAPAARSNPFGALRRCQLIPPQGG